MIKKLLTTLIILNISIVIFSQGTKEESSEYIASTSWTAAYAYVGGLDNVINIAPANLVHPPEYEILPSDIKKIQNSKAFIYAGYEVMMDTLSKNLIDENIKTQIMTINSLNNIIKQANVISDKFNTKEKSDFRVQEIKDLFTFAKIKIKEKSIDKKNVYVHFHQVAFAKSLGLNVVGSFGPNSITAKNIEDISKINNVLIIDNIHNQLAEPLLEVNENAIKIVWTNFPNNIEEKALYNMLKDNIESLLRNF